LFYQQTNLDSDNTSISASHQDANLINPWGITASPTSPFWVSDNGKGVSTIYLGDGTPQTLVVTVPAAGGSTATGSPTGIVFNSNTSAFTVSSGSASGAAFFIFATLDGTISGWNPTVNRTHAIVTADNSKAGAIYTGLALATTSSGAPQLYAANFHAGTIDVFDANFKPVTLGAGAFTDSKVAKGYAPFNVTSVGNNLAVTYAQQDSAKQFDVPGRGKGFVDIFDPSGTLITRVARKGKLNAPWGVAQAPSSFGKFASDLLVGDFGDGRINAYRQKGSKYVFAGQLSTGKRSPIVISGLWGLEFGNGGRAGDLGTLFFTAGLNGQKDGLLGDLVPTAPQ
jgi:uncharacterized protein (TIGR03118 family)